MYRHGDCHAGFQAEQVSFLGCVYEHNIVAFGAQDFDDPLPMMNPLLILKTFYLSWIETTDMPTLNLVESSRLKLALWNLNYSSA